jgi:hypothetical protein
MVHLPRSRPLDFILAEVSNLTSKALATPLAIPSANSPVACPAMSPALLIFSLMASE